MDEKSVRVTKDLPWSKDPIGSLKVISDRMVQIIEQVGYEMPKEIMDSVFVNKHHVSTPIGYPIATDAIAKLLMLLGDLKTLQASSAIMATEALIHIVEYLQAENDESLKDLIHLGIEAMQAA